MKLPVVLILLLSIDVSAQVRTLSDQHLSAPPLRQTGTASIEGTVSDVMTREPIKKAVVQISGPISLMAVTDYSGRFAFRQLTEGHYIIQAHSDSYPSTPMSFDTQQLVSLSLSADEQKQGVGFLLVPGANVRGRIVDEEGNPMLGCIVNVARFQNEDTGRTLQFGGFAQSDNKGEYQISNIPAGKYYVVARCNQRLPLPHAFVRRTAASDLPVLIFPPQFYPGVSDPAGAAKIEASPGANISGIDLRMFPAKGVSVHGHIGSHGENTQVFLIPQDPARRAFRQIARLELTGEFRVQNVAPGPYELLATTTSEKQLYFARVPVQVGTTPPDPIDLTLASAPSISGTVSIDGDKNIPVNALRVAINNPGGFTMGLGPRQAEVQADGSFTINSVMPGRWRLSVNGASAYVKTVKQSEKEVAPWNLEVGETSLELKITMGTKYAQVEMSVAAPLDAIPMTAVLWPVNGDPNFQQSVSISYQGRGTLSVPPGRYYGCAFAVTTPGVITQNRALRKALEDRCKIVDTSEDTKVQVEIPLIPTTDVKQMAEKINE